MLFYSEYSVCFELETPYVNSAVAVSEVVSSPGCDSNLQVQSEGFVSDNLGSNFDVAFKEEVEQSEMEERLTVEQGPPYPNVTYRCI